jgi:hypothetical protein
MERTQLLENAGNKVDAIWECEWNNIKNNMDIINKKNLENIARDQNIVLRDALFGGRTEAFKSY